MTKFLKLTAAAVLASLLAGSAMAQVRINPYTGAPKVVPKILLIKPSQALRIAMKAVPNGKALNLVKQGNFYRVRMKEANQVRILVIDGTSGVIQ